MTKPTRPNFSPESSKLVVDQGYKVREVADAMGVSKFTMDKWVRQLRAERKGESPKATPMTTNSVVFESWRSR